MPTPNWQFPLFQEGGQGNEVIGNTSLNILDVAVQMTLISRTVTTAPTTPNEGDAYLVPVGATGTAWVGHDNEIAFYFQGWIFRVPVEGWTAWIQSENLRVIYNGTVWATLTGTILKTLPMQSPVSGEEYTFAGRTEALWTLTEVRGTIRGAGTSVVFNLRHATDRNGTPTEIITGGGTCTNKTTGQVFTTVSNPAKDKHVWVALGTVTGAIDEFILQLEYSQVP